MAAKDSDLMFWDELFPLEQFDLSKLPNQRDLVLWDEALPLSGVSSPAPSDTPTVASDPADDIDKAA
jgi:hypothetical protein